MTACQKPATGANSEMWYIPEVTCGVTPDNPAWTLLRRNTGNMQLNKDALSSSELDGSRDRSDTRLGQNKTNGDIAFEMSYGSHDAFYAALLGGAWINGSTDIAVNVAVDGTAKTYTRDAGDFTAIFSVGDIVKFSSLSGNNAKPVVVTAVSALVITAGSVPNGFLADEVSTATDVVQADYVEIGDTCTSFSVLERFPGLDGGNGGDSITRGVKFTNLAYSLAVDSMNSGTFQTIGLAYEPNATLPVGSTFNPIVKSEVYSGVDGSIYVNNASLGFVTSANATTDTEASAQYAIGSNGASFIEQGRVMSETTLATYFTDFTLLESFANETEFKLDLFMSSDDGALMFTYGRNVFTSGAPTVDGPGSITQSLGAQAFQGTAGESSIKIQRLAV